MESEAPDTAGSRISSGSGTSAITDPYTLVSWPYDAQAFTVYSPHSPKSAPASTVAAQDPSSLRRAWYQRSAPDGEITSKATLREGTSQPEADSSREPPDTSAETEISPAENEAGVSAVATATPSMVAQALTA